MAARMPELAEGIVLVVEDERPLRQTIEWALEDEGLAVEGASNGREAVEIATRSKPALIVLDMILPLFNGDIVADRVREKYGDSVPILLMTADTRAAAKARLIGAFDYLQKPFDIEALIGAVQRGLTDG